MSPGKHPPNLPTQNGKEPIKLVAEMAKSSAEKINDEYKFKKRIATAYGKTKETVDEALGEIKGSKIYIGAGEKTKSAMTFVDTEVLGPIDGYLEKSGTKKVIRSASEITTSSYGKARAYIKPYFAPETPEALLISTKNELLYLNACMLQINRDQAEILANRLGAAITSKLAGAATVGGLMGLVSAFGTAGTGTAIASLSGAAATNATLAWVGGLLGGGMAAGAALTGGLALAVSAGVYKLLGSKARNFEELTDVERRIVESTGFLIAAINESLENKDISLSIQEAKLLLENTLKPLHELLKENAEKIVENLDVKNSVAFKQHAIIDFKNQTIDGFTFFIEEEIQARRKRYPEFAISGVIYALLTNSAVDDSKESQLALEAIRRVRGDWGDASESDISSELSEYGPEQIRGFANNAKGIYHERLFVENYNNSHDDTYAEMFGASNHPVSDVLIKSIGTDDVIAEYQLKASSGVQIVREHFEKYPDVDVLATDEIANKFQGVESSGISNDDITAHMNEVVTYIADNTIGDRVLHSAEMAGLVASGLAAIEILSGRRTASDAGVEAMKRVGIASTSTALVAYLFS
jgi:hypothetical protein